MKILAPIQKNDGCSFFRIETPSKYLDGWRIDMPQYLTNKFYHPRSGLRFVDRVTGALWDRGKLRERKKMVERQHDYDAFWLSRSLLSFKNTADQQLKNIIYDVDDAIWLNGEADHCFEHHCRESLVVFAGNSFVADHASKFTRKIEIIPTSIDVKYHRRIESARNSFNVGWIGSAAGLVYLSDIATELISFFQKHNDARLVIVTERYPDELKSLEKYIDYVPWSRNSEIESINRFTVGIMPLRNTEWERGKCSFKMLQYMGCEIPVIVSPVGMNNEVMQLRSQFGTFGEIADNSWADVLEQYYRLGDEQRATQGKAGRRAVTERYSTPIVAKSISGSIAKYL